MSEIIRVAVVCDNMTINGISKVVENYAINTDKNLVHITILGSEPIDPYFKNLYKNHSGIELISLPNKRENALRYLKKLVHYLEMVPYDIFHLHGNSMNSILQLAIARYAGISVRIMHCHNTKCTYPLLTKLLRPVFNYYCTDGFACGEDAGKWIWPNRNFTIIPNGFEVGQFVFDSTERKKIRYGLGYDDKIVIGHIGRMNEQKNQMFILDVFEQLAERNDKYELLLIGNGPDYSMIQERVKNSKYVERIKLLGEVVNPNKMYSALDFLVFPSRYEGLPVVLLEAQISGLKCFVSDRVTKELNFGDISYLSIDNSVSEWVEAILKHEFNGIDRDTYYISKKNYIEQYDINITATLLENKYRMLCGR